MPWAGRLFDTLCRHFDRKQVFMDINGGIPRGTNFEAVLNEAVTACDVMLALIGPKWLTCTNTDGTRRLDRTDDWVRSEIGGCLRRGIPVVPVLLGGAPLPAESDLPEDLRPLCKRQAAVMADTDWHDHAARLINDLVRITPLRLVRPLERDDVDSANSGIQLLSGLLSSNPAVADAVARSREVVQNTYRRIGRLEMFKNVHDALHTIEFECLRPLAAAGEGVRLRPFRTRFAAEAARIRTTIEGQDISAALRDDMIDGLQATDAAFEAALAQPGESGFARVAAELNALLSGLPSRLDAGISDTARDLDLERLVELMNTVKSVLPATTEDQAVAEFVQGIEALQRLRDELGQRVQEHTVLQRLDSKLRTVCVGGVPAGSLPAEWNRIKLARSRLAEPFSPELQAALGDLQQIERDVEDRLEASEKLAALEFVAEYFRLVAGAFRDVDRALKEFCMRLSAVSRPLKTILDLC
jgi:hypothetical protein